MSYVQRTLQDNPVGLWPLDDTSLSDVSGYVHNGTLVGTPTVNRPIVSGGISSLWVNDGGFTLPQPNVFLTGTERTNFSLECWFSPDNYNGYGDLFVRNQSGIRVQGNTLTATLSMASDITLAYAGLTPGRTYHIVLTYDTAGAYLFVNGVHVATATVTEDDLNAGFATDTSDFGFSANTGFSYTIDSAAAYNYVLTDEIIQEHYAFGLDYPNVQVISGFNNSNRFGLSDANATVGTIIRCETGGDWAHGAISGSVAVVDDTIQNLYSDTTGQFESGTWSASLHLLPQAGITYHGSRITWDSNRADLVVEVSTDGGTTFAAFQNGDEPIATLPLDGGADIVLRITFAAGAQTVVNRVNFVLYISKDIQGTNADISAVISDHTNVSLSEFDWNPAQFVGDSGILLKGGGASISVANDDAFGGYQAVELTFKADSVPANAMFLLADGANIVAAANGSLTPTNATVYLDGQKVTTASFTPDLHVWHHLIAVFPTTTGTLYVGNNAAGTAVFPMRIGHLATYYDPISDAVATQIYDAWVGQAVTRVVDPSIFDVTEHIFDSTGTAGQAYSYLWSNNTG